MEKGWIGVDLDRTLAFYDTWRGADVIGEPIAPMVERVKNWIEQGVDVRIFTARVSHDGTPKRKEEAFLAELAIEEWCYKHIGKILPVTCCKDWAMVELWDDRCVQVKPNEGVPMIG